MKEHERCDLENGIEIPHNEWIDVLRVMQNVWTKYHCNLFGRDVVITRRNRRETIHQQLEIVFVEGGNVFNCPPQLFDIYFGCLDASEREIDQTSTSEKDEKKSEKRSKERQTRA